MLSSVAIGNLSEQSQFLHPILSKRAQIPEKSFEIYHVCMHHKTSCFISTSRKIRIQHTKRSCEQVSKRLCYSHITGSLDDDCGSSRDIAISLFKRYRNVTNRGGADTLKEFINAGVNAYALGCTDEGLRQELIEMKNSGTKIESIETFGGNTSLRFKILSEEVDECMLWLSIVFITILCTPQPTIVRWSSTSPVSNEIMLQWKGFCALIANAYYVRGMAWLPVKTLQLEQLAVTGRSEEPSVVASRMRLVFSTLEEVSPQWPRV